jgi:hypothetical protein
VVSLADGAFYYREPGEQWKSSLTGRPLIHRALREALDNSGSIIGELRQVSLRSGAHYDAIDNLDERIGKAIGRGEPIRVMGGEDEIEMGFPEPMDEVEIIELDGGHSNGNRRAVNRLAGVLQTAGVALLNLGKHAAFSGLISPFVAAAKARTNAHVPLLLVVGGATFAIVGNGLQSLGKALARRFGP